MWVDFRMGPCQSLDVTGDDCSELRPCDTRLLSLGREEYVEDRWAPAELMKSSLGSQIWRWKMSHTRRLQIS